MSIFPSHFRGVISNDLFRPLTTSSLFKSCIDLLGKSFITSKNALPVHTNIGNFYSSSCKEFEHKGHNVYFRDHRNKHLEINKNESEIISCSHQEKVKSLVSILKCTEATAYNLLLKFPFLKNTKMETLNSKVSTLLEAGIDKKELINDMWILTYSLPKLKEQIRLVQNMNFDQIKPWHLRCSEVVFHRLSQNKENNRLALSPYESVTDYICKRLGLSETQVQLFASRHPPVMRVKVAKLKEIIDYLYSEGFTAQQIYNTPRILCHSLKTVQARLAVLKTQNYKPYSLFVLCKSKSKFDDFLNNLRASEN